ncbi:MAG TPA: DUF1491 family protein [Sphingomicrobium sp.]|nr:DUF1491 family protein [Sphingomicrobium sp.]
MTDARLAASVEASSLMRSVTANGGFATILAKGDAERGALLLIVTERGRQVALLERMLNAKGAYEWQQNGVTSDAAASAEWLKKRRRNDPDLWLIELDVPDAERFIAETTLKG